MTQKEFDPNVVIETKRLVLRYLDVKDSHAIFLNINNDKEVLKYFLDKYLEDETLMTIKERVKFCLENKRYFFVIELKDTHEVIGMIFQCSTPEKYFNNSCPSLSTTYNVDLITRKSATPLEGNIGIKVMPPRL